MREEKAQYVRVLPSTKSLPADEVLGERGGVLMTQNCVNHSSHFSCFLSVQENNCVLNKFIRSGTLNRKIRM
jgi:hypothetical protein